MKKILCFVAPLYEDLELWYPVIRMREQGYEVTLAGPKAQEYKGKNGIPAQAELSFEQAAAQNFDALLIPGGYAPDKMRVEEAALDLVRKMDEAQKPIGMICHAGWVGASAGIVKGRRLTSVANIKDDLIHAGAHWVDEAAVTDHHLVTSRTPEDLPDYVQAFLKVLEQ